MTERQSYRGGNDMKKSYVLVFMILPVMLICTAVVLKHARGPYYLCPDTEQDYIYLISSLALAESKPVFYTDHPGTTVQILGAATLKIAHALDVSDKDSLEFAVLKNPEFYLTVVNIVLISLNALILFIVGLTAYRLTKNIGLGLLLQFSPFFSSIPLRWGLNQVSCEPLLLFTTMLFMLVLVRMIFHDNLQKDAYWYAGILAIISGFGMATKVTFAPLLMIPLIVLPKLQHKAGYLMITGFSAMVWTLPITSQYERIFKRLYLILTHTRWYGYGTYGIDAASMQNNLQNMLTGLLYDPFTLLFFLTAVLTIIIVAGSSAARKMAWREPSFNVLFAVIVAALLSSFMVIKQSAERYALPVSCLIGFLLFLQVIYFQRRNDLRHLSAKKLTVMIMIFLVLCGAWRVHEMKGFIEERLLIKNESLAFYRDTEKKYDSYLKIFIHVIPRSIAPSPIAALSYGNNMASHEYFHISEISEGRFSKGLYSETLYKIYGEAYFYNLCSGEFYTWIKSFFIEDVIVRGKMNKIVFYIPPGFVKKEDIFLPCRTGSVLHLKDVSRGVYDNIYLLDGIAIKAVNFEQFRFRCY